MLQPQKGTKGTKTHLRENTYRYLCLFVAVMGQAPNEPVVPKAENRNRRFPAGCNVAA